MGISNLIVTVGLFCIGSKFLTSVQGSSCVSSCHGIPNGYYHSCIGCHVYATCSNGYLYDNRPCAANLVWDNNKKRCEFSSPTCPVITTRTTTSTTMSTPVNTCPSCCLDDEFKVNMTSGRRTGSLTGLGVQRNITTPFGGRCSRSIVIRADFERITTNSSCEDFGCITGGVCGRKILKVELKLSRGTRRKRLFNVADSVTNNGGGGDFSTQQNDAEADAIHPDVYIYPSDKCTYNGPRYRARNVTAANVNKVTLYISNQFIQIITDDGHSFRYCDKCLFALNGQSDSSVGGKNERIFVGINTVVYPVGIASDRRGQGVCEASFSWLCGAIPTNS